MEEFEDDSIGSNDAIPDPWKFGQTIGALVSTIEDLAHSQAIHLCSTTTTIRLLPYPANGPVNGTQAQRAHPSACRAKHLCEGENKECRRDA